MTVLCLVYRQGHKPPITTVEYDTVEEAEFAAATIISQGAWVDNVLWSPFGLSHCVVREVAEQLVIPGFVEAPSGGDLPFDVVDGVDIVGQCETD